MRERLRHHVTCSKGAKGRLGTKERKQNRKANTMTVHELKEMLEDYETDGYGNMKIKVAQQPSYPLAGLLESVCRIGNTMWFASGPATEYGPRAAWDGEDLDAEEEE